LYSTIPQLEEQIKVIENKMHSDPNYMIHDSVGPNDVSEVISKITGIPVEKLLESEKNKLLNLNKDLKK
jgi:ATP-dependent Clp protease ATP-binding subunit ClpB